MEENKLLGYCECCGLEIYANDTYTKIDGEYYCDYCGGEDGLAISEIEDDEDEDFFKDLIIEQQGGLR